MMFQSNANSDQNNKKSLEKKIDLVKQELKACNINPVMYDTYIQPILEKLKKSDPTLSSEQAYKDLVKVYTNDCLYYKLGLKFQ